MLKLSPTAFANSMAILTAAFYLLFYLINLIAPGLFRFLFNAQFLVLMWPLCFRKNLPQAILSLPWF